MGADIRLVNRAWITDRGLRKDTPGEYCAVRNPLTALPSAGDDGVHLWCCDDSISMCGLDISGDPEVPAEEDELLCPLCALVADEGAAVPGAWLPRVDR